MEDQHAASFAHVRRQLAGQPLLPPSRSHPMPIAISPAAASTNTQRRQTPATPSQHSRVENEASTQTTGPRRGAASDWTRPAASHDWLCMSFRVRRTSMERCSGARAEGTLTETPHALTHTSSL